MQSCTMCSKKMKYKQILKSYMWSYKPIACNQCGQQYVLTTASRSTLSTLIVLPIAILLLIRWGEGIEILFYLLMVSFIILTAPFFVAFKEKHKE